LSLQDKYIYFFVFINIRPLTGPQVENTYLSFDNVDRAAIKKVPGGRSSESRILQSVYEDLKNKDKRRNLKFLRLFCVFDL